MCRSDSPGGAESGTIARVSEGRTARVSEAIVVWSGHGVTAWPQPDEKRLVARFGEDQALTLLPAVTRLYDEFYESDAHLSAPDLRAMVEAAAVRFRELHPEVSAAAVEALTWCYTFDWK